MILEEIPTKKTNISVLPAVKQLIIFLIGLFGLILIEYTVQLIVELPAIAYFGLDSPELEQFLLSATHNMIISCSSYVILFIVLSLISKQHFLELTKSFRGWKPFVAAIIGLFIVYTFNFLYNSFLELINVPIAHNANENSLNEVMKQFPIISLIIFANLGPICEELTYRVGLFSLLKRKNRYLAYIVTILVFSFIHFDYTSIGTDAFFNELLNIPFYVFAGFVFTFLYEKNGLAGSVTCHILNNTLSLLAVILN